MKEIYEGMKEYIKVCRHQLKNRIAKVLGMTDEELKKAVEEKWYCKEEATRAERQEWLIEEIVDELLDLE